MGAEKAEALIPASQEEGKAASQGCAAPDSPGKTKRRLAQKLRRNHALQAAIRRALAVSGEAGEAAQRQQVQLKRYQVQQGRGAKRARCASAFSDPAEPKAVPPKNGHAVRRALFKEAYLASLGRKPWGPEEEEKLLGALRKQLQEEAFRRLYAERTRSGSFRQADKPRAFQEASREIREAKTEDIWEMQQCKTDWQSISLRLATRGVQRDAKSCFTHYLQVLHPHVNRSAFTREEDMALLQLGTLHDGFFWDKVAEAMGSGRTPWQCFSRYQRSLNPTLHRQALTEEDRSRLLGLAGKSSVQRQWSTLAAQLGEGWDSMQIMKHLRVQPAEVVSGSWSNVERRRLRIAAKIYGLSAWLEVAQHLPGRSASSCSQRFWEHEVLQGEGAAAAGRRLQTNWSEEEDQVLLQSIERLGAGNWSLIRRELPGKSGNQCFQRFQQLNPSGMADVYDVLLATKRRMLPRKPRETLMKKRSDLVASDFAIRLFEVPVPDSEQKTPADTRCTLLSTGEAKLDRHLRRLNRRRIQRFREQCEQELRLDQP